GDAIMPKGGGRFHPVATAASAKGAIITDVEGRELIDFAGGIGVVNVGHCDPEVVKAVQEQAGRLTHACIHVATYEVYIALCEKLASMFPHGDRTKVLLVNTGAEAVENAVKIARQSTGRQAVICFTEAFHGRTMMAMTLTSKVGYKIGCGPFAPETYRLPFPNRTKYGRGMGEGEFVERELARFRQALVHTVPAEHVAAVIIEPVQGEGGFTPAPFAYLRGLRKICDETGIRLIIDEVQTGFGRTGRWAAYQHSGVTPDLSTWAKSMGGGMPISAVIGRAEVMDAAKPGTLGGTYGGNPASCAAALAAIRSMERMDVNARGERIGGAIRDRFLALQRRHPGLIGEVRGLGAMIAMELVVDGDLDRPNTEAATRLMHACWERGLLIVTAGAGANIVRTLTPLAITDEQLARGLDILDEALAAVAGAAPAGARTAAIA
ncbi:MAG: aspartate aminotransferase family protein, partial [Phycisphaerales bacterium]|nr:aspartate aminotransferase family protein [Phycisphaerales bacterium]